MNELFYKCNDEERETGFVKQGEHYSCLLCDFKTELGYVYPVGEQFADAKKMMAIHIEEAHGSVFDYLIDLDKKVSGFSEHQSKVIKLFYQGLSDHEVMKSLNISSTSTVRNHRYLLKEKEKQAKTMVTLMGILSKKIPEKQVVKAHKTATMLDNRYDVSIEESINAINKYFPDGIEGPLKTFSMKEKHKIIVLREIFKRFNPQISYSAIEVDTILKQVYMEDHVVIRRYLIEYGFLERTKDGKTYWCKKQVNEKRAGKKMKDQKKKALVQAYMATKDEADVISGVYQIEHVASGKKYIGSMRRIDQMGGVEFQLNTGSFRNKLLQKAWTSAGKEAFVISILQSVKESETTQITKTLKQMEKEWKDKIKPYGDQGYHKL